ncbi:imidazole glycerol phosphate synthase subunit HisH [Candidatus Margulisiibacteriota bacterium]
MITIIDYGMGNLRSVQKSFEKMNIEAQLTHDPQEIEKAQAIVLPGVGAFGAAMTNLQKLKIINVLKEKLNSGTPYLGICLGLQILFENSEESPSTKGLGIFKGSVKHFYSDKKFPKKELTIPHMGWNQIAGKVGTKLLKGIPKEAYFYFVHSYYVEPKDKQLSTGISNYGLDFTVMIEKDNIMATQFHPEKSSPWGLKVLQNFVSTIK